MFLIKLGKVRSDPGSYRPIALTSCLCKTMKRMVNSRITWYLAITKFQCVFPKRISTVDNLVTLETSIRYAFVGIKHLVSIFFNLEKAGNMVFYWIYTKWVFVVAFLCFSVIFLSDRHFNIYTYTLILTHRGNVTRYLVSRLIVLCLVYCLILHAPFMWMI